MKEGRGGKGEGGERGTGREGGRDHTCVFCKWLLQKAKDDGVVHHKVAEVALLLCTHTCNYNYVT